MVKDYPVRTRGVTFLFLCLVSTAIFAETEETIVVSGTRFESPLLTLPSHISVINADDIALSGADHLADVLRASGGLQVSDLYGDGSDASVGLRGFATTAGQNTLIMVDGRRLNNADNSLPDLNTISLKNIEQIEIVKGGMGTLFGDKAVGGVINIITRKPDGLRFVSEAGYGSFTDRSLFASIENRHDNGLHYRVSGYRQLNANYRAQNRLRLTDIATRAGYDYRDGEVFVEYQTVSESRQLPGALFSDLVTSDRRQATNPGDHSRTGTHAGRIGIRHRLLPWLGMEAEYTNRFNEIQGQLSSAGTPGAFSQKRHHLEFTPRLIASMPFKARQIELGVGLDWFRTDYLIRSDFGITDDTQTQLGVYAHLAIPLTEVMTFTGGMRHGRVSNDILVDTINFGRSLPAGSEIDDTADAWEIGFSYLLGSHWRLFGKIDKNYRFVTADEYSSVADNNFFSMLFNAGSVVPYPDTQTGLSMELGTEWRNDNDFLSLQLFQLHIADEIVFDPTQFLNTNLGNTRRDGLILEGGYRLARGLSVSANYSYLNAEFTSGRFDNNKLTFLPRHTASISSAYRFNDSLTAFIEWSGVGGRKFDGDFSGEFAELAGYARVNFNAVYEKHGFSISLRLNNVLDAKYSESGAIAYDFRAPYPAPRVETYFPSPGRNMMLTVRYQYTRGQQ